MTSRRRFALYFAFGALGVMPALPASAQEARGFASNLSNPSERGSQWFWLDSLDIRGNGRLAVGLVNDYSYRTLMLFKQDGSVNGSLVRNQYMANMGASVNLGDRFRVAMNVPVGLFQDGNSRTVDGVRYRAAEDTAVGDVRFSGDARIFGEKGEAATVAVGAEFFIPSGSTTAYTGDGEPRFLPRVLFAGEAAGFAYAAKAGVMLRARDEAFANGYIGNALVYAASAGAKLDDGKLIVGPEILGTTVLSDSRAFDKRTSPLEVLLGAHYDVGSNLRVGAGIGTAIAPGYGAAVARGLLSLEWVPGDAHAEAPKEAPKEAAKPPADRDGDGVPDDEDACGFAAGPQASDPAKNGCPAEPPPPPPPPECPKCADADRDKDGLVNEVDACPDEAGAPDPDPKKNGCPKAFLDKGVIKITEQVRFRTASADIDPGKESTEVLEAILKVLKAHPEIAKLRIEGHTDDRGDAARNKALSKARAESVVKWLVGKGVEANKLSAEGIGADRPLETNATEAGRAANRRVELHVEQGSAK